MPTNGEKLAAWRKLHEMSQAQAAAKLSEICGWTVKQGTWCPWEHGTKAPDRETAPHIETLTGGTVRAADWPPRKRKRGRRLAAAAE